MQALRLVRHDEDKHRYDLEGRGRLQLAGRLSRSAQAIDATGAQWTLKRARLSEKASAEDVTGIEVATYRPNGGFKRGGRIVVGAREYNLRPASHFKTRFALADGETELATVETVGWSGKEVEVHLADDARVESLVLLMTCWLVRLFNEDAAASAAAT